MRCKHCNYVVFTTIRLVVFTTALLFLLSSCIGITSGIVIRNDGSGTIDMIYMVSDSLDAVGRQDGNARQPPLPLSRNDFEKTLSRIDGLSLKSYKSERQGQHVLVTATLDFAGIDALAAFLDESRQTVTYTERNGKKELVFTFVDVPVNVGVNEQALFTEALDGYMFDFSVKTQGTMEAAFVDQNGNALNASAAGNINTQNDSVSYQVPMADLVFSKEPVILKIIF